MLDMRFIEKFTSFKNRLQQRNVGLLRAGVGVFLFFSISLPATALAAGSIAPTEPSHDEDVPPIYNDTLSVYTQKILFPRASAVVLRDFAGNDARIDSIASFLAGTGARNLLNVRVTGSYSPEGTHAFNINLADARARALAGLIRKMNPDVRPETSIRYPSEGQGSDYRQLRAAELQIIYRHAAAAGDATVADTAAVSGTAERPDTKDMPTESSVGTADTNNDRHVAAQQPDSRPAATAPRSGHTFGSRLFVTTNMLYDAALTPNIGVGISLADRVTLQADWMYARWSNRDKRRYWRIYGGDVELRYRMSPRLKGSPLGGHYVGAYGSMACYDFQAGRSHSGVLSDKYNYAAGLSYTYSLPLSARLNLDFNLGVGYLWGTYKKQRLIDDCDVWLSTHKLGWFGPTRAGITLVWLVGNAVANKKKGGNR